MCLVILGEDGQTGRPAARGEMQRELVDERDEAIMTPFRLRDPERFDAWLHRLLVRACIDEARRLRRQRLDVDLTEIPFQATDDRAP